jgi:hypothetical protein
MIFLQGFISLIKASPRNVPDKIDAEEGRIIRIIITRYHMIWRIITWLPIKKTMTIINLEEQNLLGNQSVPESEDFCILAAILDSKWSLYGAACLTSCKYPFPLKSFHFWIFKNLFWFYIGSHFENFKNKEHNFEWWSIFVSSFKSIRCTEWI